MIEAKLVEPGMKMFMNSALITSKKIKFDYYNLLLNIVCFIVFILILIILLTIRYKGKLSPLEKYEQLRKQKFYILSKIKQLQDVKRQRSQELVTNLPKFDEYDYNNNNKYYV